MSSIQTSTIKVSSKSNPKGVAGAIASQVREGSTRIECTIIGAGSLNQFMKAVAIARGHVVASGKDLAVIPSFSEAEVAGVNITAMFLVIDVRNA